MIPCSLFQEVDRQVGRVAMQGIVRHSLPPPLHRPLLLLLVAVVTLAAGSVIDAAGRRPQLLLVSFDGFRAGYVDKARMPFLRQMMADGVRVRRVKSAFPTATFPNHWTVVTGRRPENHDIVANNMYDPVSKDKFSLWTSDSKWWNTSEPIWLTATKLGLKTAAYYWPGSDVELQGYRPVHWLPFAYYGAPNLVRVNEVIRWLKNDSIDFVALYFNQPDEVGHNKGPDAPETIQMVEEMDSVLGYLMYMLHTYGLKEKVNVIVMSDHGMTSTSKSQIINLSSYTNWSCVEWHDLAEVGFILPKSGFLEKVYNDLKNASQHMQVFYKEELPERLHYKNSKRITPIVIIPNEGYLLSIEAENGSAVIGVHGYDNELESMAAIFVATGPDFRRAYEKDSIESVDIYPLLCRLLGINPQPYDGNANKTTDLLRSDQEVNESSAALTVALYSSVVSTVGFCLAAVFLVNQQSY